MGAVNTTYTFTATDTITSTKMNNIIDQTTMTGDAVIGTTLEVANGQLKIRPQGVTSNELAENAVKTIAIEDGAVTSAKLNSSVILVPAGAVMPFAMNSAPTGWLAANGAEYSKVNATYLALFTAIGVVYGETNGSGGVGTTHFRVPDLRGYFVRGHGVNIDGTTSNSSFGEKKADTLQGHTHTQLMGTSYDNVDNYNNGTAARANRTGGSGNMGLGIAADGTNGTPRTSAETVPRNISLLYCIKY
jgi:microcystin-dependent protein